MLTRRLRRRSDSERLQPCNCSSFCSISERRTALSSLALPIYYFSGVLLQNFERLCAFHGQELRFCSLLVSYRPLAPRNPRLAMTRTETSKSARAGVDAGSREALPGSLLSFAPSTLATSCNVGIASLQSPRRPIGTAHSVVATGQHEALRNDDTAPLLQICCHQVDLSSGKGDLHLHPPQEKTPSVPCNDPR